MDNITSCAIAARKAGMSYGQYMATQRQAQPQPIHREQPEPEPANTRICKVCGKEFDLSSRAHNSLYCGPACSRQVNSKQAWERERAKRNISTDDILTCPWCGKSFARGDRHASVKYCSEECKYMAKRARRKEKQTRAESYEEREPIASAEIIL